MNCGDEGGDGKAGFVLAKRTLMARRPELVAQGKNVSLREHGGEKLLGTPSKPKTTRVVVYPKKTDGFDAAGDQLLMQVELPSIESTAETGNNAGSSKQGSNTDLAEGGTTSKKQKVDDGSNNVSSVQNSTPACDKETATDGSQKEGAEPDSC